MKIRFTANACCTFQSEGVQILCDPWLKDGAFEGAWHHYPPLKTTAKDLTDVDAIYVSHLHPDHYDPETLSQFDRETPLIIMDKAPNFLEKMLGRDGFKNIIKLKPGAPGTFKNFTLTIFEPFVGHVFYETKLGNVIDSAIMLESNGFRALNTNDNTPDEETCRKLKKEFGEFDLFQMNYNAAGPYPSCFRNLTKEQKLEEHANVLKRNIDHFVACTKIMDPKFVMPFAGNFVIGGNGYEKNEYMGTTTWDEAGAAINRALPEQKVCLLQEGQSFDLASGEMLDGPYVPVDVEAQKKYINEVISNNKYTFEDDAFEPAEEYVLANLKDARENLWGSQDRFKVHHDLDVYIKVKEGTYFFFNFDKEDSQMVDKIDSTKPYIECEMDIRLLSRILKRQAHWNNCEIGMHIEFDRQPNTYVPDFHFMMSFFHLPLAKV